MACCGACGDECGDECGERGGGVVDRAVVVGRGRDGGERDDERDGGEAAGST